MPKCLWYDVRIDQYVEVSEDEFRSRLDRSESKYTAIELAQMFAAGAQFEYDIRTSSGIGRMRLTIVSVNSELSQQHGGSVQFTRADKPGEGFETSIMSLATTLSKRNCEPINTTAQKADGVYTRVLNLRTLDEAIYCGVDPRSAVIAAYAFFTRKDPAAAHYSAYEDQVKEGQYSWFCGDWSALKRMVPA